MAALLSSPIVHCGRWYRSGGYTTTKARQGEARRGQLRWGTMWEGSSNKPQGPLRSRAAGKKCCYPGLCHPSKPKPKLASRRPGFNISAATNICSSSQATINLWRCGRNPRSEEQLWLHSYRHPAATGTVGDGPGVGATQQPRQGKGR